MIVLHPSVRPAISSFDIGLVQDLKKLPALVTYGGVKLTGDSSSADNASDFLCFLLSALVDDFSINSRPAFWVGQKALFLPCECEQVGLAALRFLSAISSRSSRSFALIKDLPYQRLEKLYEVARKQMRSVGLNQTNVALGRAAIKQGVAVERLVTSRNQVLIFGQGIHRKLMFETASCQQALLLKVCKKIRGIQKLF